MTTQPADQVLTEAAGRWQRTADAMRAEADRIKDERDQADREQGPTVPEPQGE